LLQQKLLSKSKNDPIWR